MRCLPQEMRALYLGGFPLLVLPGLPLPPLGKWVGQFTYRSGFDIVIQNCKQLFRNARTHGKTCKNLRKTTKKILSSFVKTKRQLRGQKKNFLPFFLYNHSLKLF